MRITKLFEAESSHIVRNCSTKRCSHSIHGHSYKIELELEGSRLDNAGMLYDFGLLKGAVKTFIDSLDHTHIYNRDDDKEYIQFCRVFSDRVIGLPFNPSAEMLALWIHATCQLILEHTIKKNNESEDLRVSSVTVWETRTGRAQTSASDLKYLWKPEWFSEIFFSAQVIEDWTQDLRDILWTTDSQTHRLSPKMIENPIPFKQI